MYAPTSYILNDSHVDFKRHAAFLLFSFYALEWPLFSLVDILIKNALNEKKSGDMILLCDNQHLPNMKRSYVGTHGTTEQCRQQS
jgi:Fe2+ transport system protein B